MRFITKKKSDRYLEKNQIQSIDAHLEFVGHYIGE